MRPRQAGPLIAVLAIHAFGYGTWVGWLGFSSDIGTDSQFEDAITIGGLLWLAAAALIVVVWMFRRPAQWFAWIPFAWWLPSFILVVFVVYDTPAGFSPSPAVSPQPQRAHPRTPFERRSLCTEDGIRYVGASAQGEVCFTLTPDRSGWVEIGFAFARARGCDLTASVYHQEPEPTPLDGPGRILMPGFTATIDGVKASGVLEDPEICPSETFNWRARKVPR
jgi:hypothetical protein